MSGKCLLLCVRDVGLDCFVVLLWYWFIDRLVYSFIIWLGFFIVKFTSFIVNYGFLFIGYIYFNWIESIEY